MTKKQEIRSKIDKQIANSMRMKKAFRIEINRWGDLHFKKKMLESLAENSNILQCEDLIMRFENEKIIIEKAEKLKSQ